MCASLLATNTFVTVPVVVILLLLRIVYPLFKWAHLDIFIDFLRLLLQIAVLASNVYVVVWFADTFHWFNWLRIPEGPIKNMIFSPVESLVGAILRLLWRLGVDHLYGSKPT